MNPRRPLTRDDIFIRLGILVVVGLMTLQTVFMTQFTLPGELTKSAFQRYAGLPCPLCGGTRAMRALFLGDRQRALYLNWLALPVALAGVALVAGCVAELAARRRLFPPVRPGRRSFLLAAAVIIVLWAWQIFSALHTPKPELLNRHGLFFKFYKFPETR